MINELINIYNENETERNLLNVVNEFKTIMNKVLNSRRVMKNDIRNYIITNGITKFYIALKNNRINVKNNIQSYIHTMAVNLHRDYHRLESVKEPSITYRDKAEEDIYQLDEKTKDMISEYYEIEDKIKIDKQWRVKRKDIVKINSVYLDTLYNKIKTSILNR